MSENDERGRSGGELSSEGVNEAAEPVGAPSSEQPDQADGGTRSGAKPGQMRFQDETTVPREPTLAERRARQQAARREREEAAAKYAADEAHRKKRKRILIGTGVTVGVVALIAVGYAVANSSEDVEARCVDENNVVVDDGNCVQPASNTTYHSGGGFFPIFIGGGGRQYHYNYGGSGTIGQVATGGTTVEPKNATVRTPSGKTISRGGLGVSSGGSSGSKGGSSGSSGS